MRLIVRPYIDENGVLRIASFEVNNLKVPVEISKRSFNSMDEVENILKLMKKETKSNHNYGSYKIERNGVKNLVFKPSAYDKLRNGFILEKCSIKSTKHSKNEDATTILKKGNNYLLMVCDGVGGVRGGEIASNMVVDNMSKFFLTYDFSKVDNTNDVVNDFAYKIKEISNELASLFRDNPLTTLNMAIVLENETEIFNVGDSRCYAIGNDNNIKLVTSDHSFVWNNYIKTNKLGVDDLRFTPGNNIITSSIGDFMGPKIDVYWLNNNDYKALILCSDGVSDVLSSREIRDTVINNKDNIANKMVGLVRNKTGYNYLDVQRCRELFANVDQNYVKDDDASVVVFKK
ncbi:MAG: protein phosphatase 2C domain-containing protein [Tenericutes bacterium]|nr:protein phosphatase 2C domain-containing protein [Mycoplasmatota bacterium]